MKHYSYTLFPHIPHVAETRDQAAAEIAWIMGDVLSPSEESAMLDALRSPVGGIFCFSAEARVNGCPEFVQIVERDGPIPGSEEHEQAVAALTAPDELPPDSERTLRADHDLDLWKESRHRK